MTSVQQTVVERIQRNPGINQTRSDALFTLLALSSITWGWVDGEFVSIDDDARNTTTQFTVAQGEAEISALFQGASEDVLSAVLEANHDRFVAEERIASEAAERATRTGFSEPIRRLLELELSTFKNFNPFQGAPFLNVPADANRDWVEAASEVRALLEAKGFTF